MAVRQECCGMGGGIITRSSQTDFANGAGAANGGGAANCFPTKNV